MSGSAQPVVTCPTCRKPVVWTASERFKPFCSERCKLIDLGDWATEAHKIPGQPALELSENLLDDAEYQE